MATPTAIHRLRLQTGGTNAGLWDGYTEDNLNRLEEAISQRTALVVTGGTDTLTQTNYAADETRSAFLDVSGTLASNETIVVPAVAHKWVVKNGTSGAFTTTIKVTGLTGVEIPQGYTAAVWCNGTDVFFISSPVPNAAGVFPSTWIEGTDVASAADLDLLADGNVFNVTGATGPITSIDTTGENHPVGSVVVTRFASTPTMTHHATNLVLLSGADITAAAGDFALWEKYGAGTWRMVSYSRADGTAIVAPAAFSPTVGNLSAIFTADGEVLVGTGAGTGALESGSTLRDTVGVGTGDSPQFTGIELGHATDTTLTRVSAGVAAVEGNNIVLDGTAAAVVSGTDVLLGGQTIFPMWREHNLAVNSHFQVSQENGDTDSTSNGYFLADQFASSTIGSAAITYGRDAASGIFSTYPEIPYMLKITTTTGAAEAVADTNKIRTYIEGQRINPLLKWGASGGNDLRIAFLAYTTMAGDPTFSVAVHDGSGVNSYIAEYTLISNTETWVNLTITAPTGSYTTWAEDNTRGMLIDWNVGQGTNYDGVAGWNVGDLYGTTSTDNLTITTGNDFYLGPVLIFPEGIPMPADANELHLFQRPYDRDLRDCQRYYFQYDRDTDGDNYVASGYAVSTTAANFTAHYPVEMCAAPTISGSAGTSDFQPTTSGNADFEWGTATGIGKKAALLQISGGTGLVAAEAVMLSVRAGSWIKFNARL